MKKLITLFAAFFAATGISFAAIGMSGFVDASYSDSDQSLDIDEVEVRLSLDNEGTVGGVLELTATGTGSSIDTEQVYLTYALGEGSSLKIGNFESTLGFDGYDADSLIANAGGLNVINTYDSGVQYSSGALTLGLAEATPATPANAEDELSGDNYVVEASYSMDLGNGLNVFVGARMNESDNSEIINAYLTYESGAATFFVEMFENDATSTHPDFVAEGTQYGVVYSYSDTASVTARITDNDGADGWTLAHASQLADDLALVLDLSDNEDGQNTTVELLYTF
jgi:hypothetical protein